jgi:hypothetical protein
VSPCSDASLSQKENTVSLKNVLGEAVKINNWPGTGAHTYNPSYLGGKDQEDLHSRTAQHFLVRPHVNQQKAGQVVGTCHPSFVGGINRRTGALAKDGDAVQKISKVRKTGGVAQVIECLPSKSEALIQHPHH